jgi:valacyclovir hydrolase
VSFWQYAHGSDWELVVEEDNRLLEKLAEAGGDFFQNGLDGIQCPVLFTLSQTDNMLYQGASQVVKMAKKIPLSQIFIANEGEHPLMWSRPEEFFNAADSFLSKIVDIAPN